MFVVVVCCFVFGGLFLGFSMLLFCGDFGFDLCYCVLVNLVFVVLFFAFCWFMFEACGCCVGLCCLRLCC